MGYVSNTDAERKEMLDTIGVRSFEDLLQPIPPTVRRKAPLDVPEALPEATLLRRLAEMAAGNFSTDTHISFLGAGIYDHFRPAVVAALASRGEFATSYTPYQPELSQGMLQAMYEYQTLICALTQMDLANASMYDGATALAEAALMAVSVKGRNEVVALRTLNPHYLQVLRTYLSAADKQLTVVDLEGGVGTVQRAEAAVSENTACLILQHPNFFGCLEHVPSLVEAAHSVGALAIASVDPISLGLLTPPGELGVDLAVGEGQALGNPIGFGGPLLGFFACRKEFVRSFPGRIVGATVDAEGRRAYTMTLRTREQDIRRERATSNICTNQALLALCATIYLCELGREGLRQVAHLCLQKSHYLMDRLTALPGVQPTFPDARFFKEFAIRLPVNPEDVNRGLVRRGFIGGLNLRQTHPELGNSMLLCVTETRSREDMDRFAQTVGCLLAEAL